MALDHFGFLAPFYDRLIRFGETDALTRRLGLPVSGALLDAGGGTGRASAALHGMAASLVVADVSRGMLRQARAKGLAAVNGPAEALPFPSGAFDRVLMVDALHHVADQAAVAGELWRVLSPGGRIVIGEPDIRQPLVKGIALFEKLALMRSHFLPSAKIVRLFAALGGQGWVEVDGMTAWVIIENVREK